MEKRQKVFEAKTQLNQQFKNMMVFLYILQHPWQGLRADLITSYCHGTKCKKKKRIDARG